MEDKIKVVTGKVRLSYLNAFEARAQEAGAKPKFSTGVIIDAADEATLTAIRKAINDVAQANASKFPGGKVPKVFKNPLRDGDEKGDANYEGKFFFNCSTLRQPPVVDGQGNPVSKEGIKSGDYGRVSVTFYFYESKTAKGVAAGLNAIQFLESGEPMGKAGSGAVADFGIAKNDFGV